MIYPYFFNLHFWKNRDQLCSTATIITSDIPHTADVIITRLECSFHTPHICPSCKYFRFINIFEFSHLICFSWNMFRSQFYVTKYSCCFSNYFRIQRHRYLQRSWGVHSKVSVSVHFKRAYLQYNYLHFTEYHLFYLDKIMLVCQLENTNPINFWNGWCSSIIIFIATKNFHH